MEANHKSPTSNKIEEMIGEISPEILKQIEKESKKSQLKPNKTKKRVLIITPIIIFLASIIFFPNHPGHRLFKEYFSLFSAWPIAALTLGILLIHSCKDAISERIKKSTFTSKSGNVWGIYDQKENNSSDTYEKKLANTSQGTEEKTALFQIGYFERTIRRMFKSQFRLLCFIQQKGRINILESIDYHNEYIRLSRIKDYQLDQYLNFLSPFLATNQDEPMMLCLSDLGKNFLAYCQKMNYTENEFFPMS